MGDPLTKPVGALDRQTNLRDDITQQLLADILQQSIRPGDRLVAQRLAKQLGVSATPLREALVELASVGMIEFLPNRGAVCLPFGARELREIYDLRRVFEVEATRLACGRLPVSALRELRCGLDSLIRQKTTGWSNLAMDLDARIHTLITAGCGSLRLGYEIGRYCNLMQSIREVIGDKNHVQRSAVEQHIEIVDALIDADAEGACRAMARHIDLTASAAESAFFQSLVN